MARRTIKNPQTLCHIPQFHLAYVCQPNLPCHADFKDKVVSLLFQFWNDKVTTSDIKKALKDPNRQILALVMYTSKSHHLQYHVLKALVFSQVDKTHFALDYIGVTHRRLSEFDANMKGTLFEILPGIGLSDFFLHILSCISKSSHPGAVLVLTYIPALVPFYKSRQFSIIKQVSSGIETDEWKTLPEAVVKQVHADDLHTNDACMVSAHVMYRKMTTIHPITLPTNISNEYDTVDLPLSVQNMSTFFFGRVHDHLREELHPYLRNKWLENMITLPSYVCDRKYWPGEIQLD